MVTHPNKGKIAGCGLVESEAQILMVCDGLPHDIVNNNDEKERS